MANKNRDGLLKLQNNLAHVVVTFNDDGILAREVNPFTHNIHSTQLGNLFDIHLDSDDQSVLHYLVTPEMEIERIFNSLRYKYLQAVHLSKISNPEACLHYTFNKAFQALAGLNVYQGNPLMRKANNDFWQGAGFTVEARELNWQKEQGELKAILSLLKVIAPRPVTKVYAELIAIKPGFHELYLHDDYFDADSIPTGVSPRDQVFRSLRNKGDLSSLTLDAFPKEMNKRDYFGYAPCNVTEGPFTFRKSINVSYFDEIRRIRTKRQIRTLDDKFHILDYCRHDLSTQEKLGSFLELAKPFCRYPDVTP